MEKQRKIIWRKPRFDVLSTGFEVTMYLKVDEHP
jgi:coenzyme PQQ precursor peptide PqqA